MQRKIVLINVFLIMTLFGGCLLRTSTTNFLLKANQAGTAIMLQDLQKMQTAPDGTYYPTIEYFTIERLRAGQTIVVECR